MINSLNWKHVPLNSEREPEKVGILFGLIDSQKKSSSKIMLLDYEMFKFNRIVHHKSAENSLLDK